MKTCPDCQVDLVADVPPLAQPSNLPVPANNPPLYKPANKRCPSCGKYQGFRRSLRPFIWDPLEWTCAQCRAVLTYDFGRMLLWQILLSLAACGIAVLAGIAFGESAIYIVVFLLPPILWWSASIKLKTPPRGVPAGNTEMNRKG